MSRIVESYYQNLFSPSSPTEFIPAIEAMSEEVTYDMNLALEHESTGEEIKYALYQIHPTKAPWSDGMHFIFLSEVLAYSER